MEEEEIQYESEETLVPRLNHRPRKTTKASGNFKNYQAWDWLVFSWIQYKDKGYFLILFWSKNSEHLKLKIGGIPGVTEPAFFGRFYHPFGNPLQKFLTKNKAEIINTVILGRLNCWELHLRYTMVTIMKTCRY